MRALLILLLACLTSAQAFAQGDRNATVLITIVDETRAVLPGAMVTLTGIDASNKAEVIKPEPTSQQGQVKFENLRPGRYSIAAEFPGFQTRALPDVRIRSGENRQVLMLPLERLEAAVTVERDRQTAASDRDVTFGIGDDTRAD